MIISVNWLKQLTDITLPIDELAILIGARLVEIEEVIDLGAKYKDVVVARVVSAQPLEGSDHLNVVRIDDGGAVQGVERGEDGLVQVVCGAPNVREGLLVAWLPPNSPVPETYGSDEPFVLDARKLRGVMSNGMIASARELGLWDEHEGILELDKDLAPGSSFAEGYELDDYLLDIENKSLTHRPDCFGVVGFAREVAVIQGNTFKTPEWLLSTVPDFGEKFGELTAPKISIDNAELCGRYEAVVLAESDGAAKSPLQLQTYLARVGVRPISAVVDVTNYLMLQTGQPLHAFDYDKLVAEAGGEAVIHVRSGRNGEKLLLLDGREIELSEEDIVIAAGEKAVGLAGAMGGATTEIDSSTKNVILESATFNLYNLRATQMRHGIFSEAITRFTKGQPAALGAPVLAEAVRLMGEYASAKRVSDVADDYPGKREPVQLRVSVAKINDVLGSSFTMQEAADVLRRVEFEVTVHDHEMNVIVPYWREDIHIVEDVIEEIGRLNGFDSIEPTLPGRDFRAVRPALFDRFRAQVRMSLARAGGNEVLTYSFVHGDMLEKAGQLREDSYKIINSISPDLQYYRQSLTPNLLNAVHGNIKQEFDEFALFELNKTHQKQHGFTHEQVPAEQDMLALVFARKKPGTGAPYYQAKKMLEYLAQTLGVTLRYDDLGDTLGNDPVSAPFEPKRTAHVFDKKTGKVLGVIGEYKRSAGRAFKLPEYAAGFELDSRALFEASQQVALNYRPISRYPGTERDMCFQVAAETTYAQVAEAAGEVLEQSPLETALEPVDIYQATGDNVKNITLRVKMTSHNHTLTGEEATQLVDQIVQRVTSRVSAKLI